MIRIIGFIVLLLLGFTVFTILTGFGMIIGYILITVPAWHIVLGTLVSSLGIIFISLAKVGEKE